ncbi:hypothetical protein OG384_04660 [Streptomyces sp. NBC_01324]|uniref:hypothetical protein n=1 Tax=Streptomyces sp. NBC_01324 TaxID=2903826 RepID=UPI002E0F64C3|nr:hypothetical protein OG384_04660 [Streptomyces sp. NBC_01324]
MTPIEIAEIRARKSDNAPLYMLAYSAGWNAAKEGGDLNHYAAKVDLEGEAGFIEGAAAYRAQTATARDFMPSSPAHVNYLLAARNA